MQQMIIDTSALRLPPEVAGKLRTEQVIIREVDNGFLLMPVQKHTRRLRGMLKGTGFSYDRFMEQRRADKEMEE